MQSKEEEQGKLQVLKCVYWCSMLVFEGVCLGACVAVPLVLFTCSIVGYLYSCSVHDLHLLFSRKFLFCRHAITDNEPQVVLYLEGLPSSWAFLSRVVICF